MLGVGGRDGLVQLVVTMASASDHTPTKPRSSYRTSKSSSSSPSACHRSKVIRRSTSSAGRAGSAMFAPRYRARAVDQCCFPSGRVVLRQTGRAHASTQFGDDFEGFLPRLLRRDRHRPIEQPDGPSKLSNKVGRVRLRHRQPRRFVPLALLSRPAHTPGVMLPRVYRVEWDEVLSAWWAWIDELGHAILVES